MTKRRKTIAIVVLIIAVIAFLQLVLPGAQDMVMDEMDAARPRPAATR